MSSSRNVRLRHFLRGVLATPLLLVLLAAAAVGVLFASRPPRTNYQEALFQGVTYIRQVRTRPRPLLIHIVKVDLTAPGIGFLVTPGNAASSLETLASTTSDFVRQFNAQVAINGSFFKPFHSQDYTINNYYPHTGDPVDVTGLAISNGQVYSPDDGPYPKACFADHSVQISSVSCPTNTMQALAGSGLLVEHSAVVTALATITGEPQPRSAIALDSTAATLWLVVVDGRQPGYSEGVTLYELADILRGLGAATALNLDGGGSSTLVTAGPYGPRILNAPIHTRIPMRERPVANHLGIFALPLRLGHD